jgi:hypothetical protein
MNYKKIYDELISRAKSENRGKGEGVYYEGHHILPRCLGGRGYSNNPKHPNIVLLTAREHFVAHLLLTKIYPDNNKIINAYVMLVRNIVRRGKFNSTRNRKYEKISVEASLLQSTTCYLINIYNGEVSTFMSKNDCERYFQVVYNKKRNKLKQGLIYGDFIYCEKILTKDEIKEYVINNKKDTIPILRICPIENKILSEHKTYRECVSEGYSNVGRSLNNWNHYGGGFMFSYKTDYYILGRKEHIQNLKPKRKLTIEFINDCVNLKQQDCYNKHNRLFSRGYIWMIKKDPQKFINKLK